MCFSAEASFAAGVVLLPAGIYCIQSACRKSPRFLALAFLPFLFSIQQFCEGFVWIGLNRGDMPFARGAGLVFLFFALFLWPFWVPFSVSLFEDRKATRYFLSVVALLALGFGWAHYAPIMLDSASRFSVGVAHHSIRYGLTVIPAFDVVAGEGWRLMYLASICCPLLVSGTRQFTIFSITLIASAVLSHLVFWYAFESVWCFFSAVLALQLCQVFRDLPAPRVEGTAQPELPFS